MKNFLCRTVPKIEFYDLDFVNSNTDPNRKFHRVRDLGNGDILYIDTDVLITNFGLSSLSLAFAGKHCYIWHVETAVKGKGNLSVFLRDSLLVYLKRYKYTAITLSCTMDDMSVWEHYGFKSIHEHGGVYRISTADLEEHFNKISK